MLHVHTYIGSFINASLIKFLHIFCVRNINVSLQFADTIILNIGVQLVGRAWLYYTGLDACPRCIYKYG